MGINSMPRVIYFTEEFMNHFKPLLFVMAICASLALAQIKLGPKDVQTLPPSDLNRVNVGDEAPDFTLEKEPGKPVTLSQYRGQKTVVLVFYRGYW
jgi:cytochrome oxidase Cu insertion factor (SCO1/SenC/PrrC family)